MVPEFDAYCFDPTTEKGAIGVVESALGTHLARLEKRGLGLGLALTLTLTPNQVSTSAAALVRPHTTRIAPFATFQRRRSRLESSRFAQ